MESLCATYIPDEDAPEDVKRTLRDEVLAHSIHEHPITLDGTYAANTDDSIFEDYHEPLEHTRVELEDGRVYMYGRYVAFWAVEALFDLYLKPEPCDGRVLLVHANIDDVNAYTGWLYRWVGDGYEKVDAEMSEHGHEPVIEYFEEEHGLFPRSYSYAQLDSLPDR